MDDGIEELGHWRDGPIVWYKFKIPCVNCTVVRILELAGDLYSALDTEGWWPVGGWTRDAEPLGGGWLCPNCKPADAKYPKFPR